ncbi:MAG TPA: hypothetical protein VK476_00970, partial [Flavobacterium sp.]|nr:hypothetical protein [Flavobacterium sp.]
MKTQNKYLYLLTSLYFIVGFIGICHHELWLDEAHHWLLARDSNSVSELLQNTQNEGHPVLWNLLLYAMTRFTLNPFWMQLLHLIIATAAVVVFLRKAPFNWGFKALFIFGYFMFFEYALISRNYILGVFFLFLACSVFESRHKKFILLSVFLALAANVHLIFAVIAFAIFLILIFEQFMEKRSFRKPAILIGCFIFIIGLALSAIQIIPSGSTQFFNHIHEMPLSDKFTKGFISLFKGLMTIPDFRSIHFWNSNYFVNLSKPLAAIAGLLLYVVPLLLFFKSRKTLFFVYTALLGTQVFFFLTQMSATRHDGMTFLIIIVGMWIEHYFAADDYKLSAALRSNFVGLLKNPIVYGILLIHFFSGIYAYAMDYRYAFTPEKEINDFLKQQHLNTQNILAANCSGTIVSPNLQ